MYITHKSLLKRVHGAWRKYAPTGVLVMATGAMWVALPAAAQDTVPETPAELRDFRLDTPPPRAKVPEPVAAPPSAEINTGSAQSATSPSTIKPRPRPLPTVKTPTAKRLPDATATATIIPDAPATTAPSLADDPPTAVPAASDAPLLPANGAPDWLATAMRLWPLLAIFLATILGWFAIRFLRNRRRDTGVKGDAAAERQAAIPAQISINAQPSLNASFEPSSARLSLANLTVTGCLRICYDGTKPLQSLRLRNQVISACRGQRAMIEAFHQDADAGRVDILGAAQPGEEIILTLELQVPRDALQAYDWRERRFIAPILLLNLTADDPAVPPYHSNCLIGQESELLSARMRPLPVDRGPKYFGALRFRPIVA
jgi:hypothetical protein